MCVANFAINCNGLCSNWLYDAKALEFLIAIQPKKVVIVVNSLCVPIPNAIYWLLPPLMGSALIHWDMMNYLGCLR